MVCFRSEFRRRMQGARRTVQGRAQGAGCRVQGAGTRVHLLNGDRIADEGHIPTRPLDDGTALRVGPTVAIDEVGLPQQVHAPMKPDHDTILIGAGCTCSCGALRFGG